MAGQDLKFPCARPANTILVGKKGSVDFTSIAAALAKATTGTWIRVAPGVYVEPPLTVPDNVTVEGDDIFNTIVVPLDPNSPMFTVGNNSQIGNLFINGVTNNACIYSPPGITDSYIYDAIFDNSVDGVKMAGNNVYVVCRNIFSLASMTRALYSIATGLEGGILCNGLITRGGTSAQADSSIIQLSGYQGESGVNGLYANGGEIIINTASLYEITNVLRANNSGIIRGSGINVVQPGTWDVLQEDSNSQILVSSAQFSSDRISAVNFDNIKIDFNDTKEGDEGLTIMKELHVGAPELGQESVFGEGDSYTRGMLVYTETVGGTFADVSAAARSAAGSTFTFPGIAADNKIYVASSLINGGDYLKHFGIKALVSTAAVIGSGEIVAEYWNGSSWIEFHHMSSEASGNFYPYADQIFERTDDEQIRFNPNINGTWIKNDPISPAIGTNYFWMRYRIKTAITTAPIFEQFKLHSSRTEINNDGWTEFFGVGRPIKTIPWDYNTFKGISPNSPGDVNLIALDYPGGSIGDLKAGMLNNSFTGGVFKIIGKAIYAPYDIDTSAPLTLRMVFQTSATGDAAFNINFGVTADGDSITTSGGAISIRGEQHLTAVKTVTAANQQFSLDVDIDVSKVIPRRPGGGPDIFWLSIGRLANSGLDTLNGTVNMIQISPTYTAWSQGSHQ